MASLDSIAADQRAVLQMILQRGLGYDEIATMLGIDRAAVRQRALDGFDALAAPGAVPALQRALITDYLLGQLPRRVADEVYARLAGSETDRAWAFAVGGALGESANRLAPLPDADAGPLLDTDVDEVDSDIDEPAHDDPPAVAAGGEPHAPEVSRRGGALLLAIPAVVLVVAVVVFAVALGGGNKKPIPARFQPKTNTAPAQTTSTPATTSAPATTTPAAGSSKMLAALNLTSPTGAKDTTGLVQVIRESGLTGIVVIAQGMPANSAHNAYAIWLRNEQSGVSKIVGYLQTKVKANGKLETEGQLPTDAADFDQILVTLETQPNPKSPGQVILSGPFREKP